MHARSAMRLDLTSAHKALASLERAIVRSKKTPEDEELRDAVIQRFEFTFGGGNPEAPTRAGGGQPASIDRLAFQISCARPRAGLLADVEAWMEYADSGTSRRILMTRQRPRASTRQREVFSDAQALVRRSAEIPCLTSSASRRVRRILKLHAGGLEVRARSRIGVGPSLTRLHLR
jgi:hypothetical protein